MENKKKIDFEKIKQSSRYRVRYAEVQKIVDAEYIIKLRESLNMTQFVFAGVLGFQLRTIKKVGKGQCYNSKDRGSSFLYFRTKP